MRPIKIPAKYLMIGILPSLFVAGFLFALLQKTEVPVDGLEEKFTVLSNAQTNYCAAPNFLDSKDDTERLQGSCCSAMDFHSYTEQIEGLKQYSDIDVIPSDPYDIEVSLAKTLISYGKTITLDEQQQKVYDDAVKMSAEGGPCCCKCWRWFAFEGQAKYLITNYNFNEKQIAQVWDLEDGCGGSGHADHYEPDSKPKNEDPT